MKKHKIYKLSYHHASEEKDYEEYFLSREKVLKKYRKIGEDWWNIKIEITSMFYNSEELLYLVPYIRDNFLLGIFLKSDHVSKFNGVKNEKSFDPHHIDDVKRECEIENAAMAYEDSCMNEYYSREL